MSRATRSALGVLAFTGAFVAWIALDIGGPRVTQWVDDLAVLAAAALGCGACLWAFRRGSGRAWLWLALWLGSWTVGQAVWSVYELGLGREVPFPSPADVFFLAAVPFALVGLTLLPSGWGATTRARSLVDGAMIAASLVAAAWAPVLAPLARDAEHSLGFALGLAYPATDLVLIVLAIWVAQHARPGHRRPIAWLALGATAVGAADAAFGALTAAGRYATGQLTDAGWMLGFLLVGVAAVCAVDDDRAGNFEERPHLTAWITTAPYLPLVALLVSAAVEQLATGRVNGVLVLIAIPVGTLTVVRQALVHLENARLTDQLLEEIDQHRQSQTQLALAQQITHLGSWEWDLETSRVAWSDEQFRIYGLEPGSEEPGYERFVGHLHPDDRAMVMTQIARVGATRRFEEFTHRIVRPNGEVRWIRSHGMVVIGDDGTQKIVGASLDITEEKQAEQDLLEAELRFQQGFEHSPVGMVMLDPSGVVLRSNDAFASLIGRDRAETVGLSAPEFTVPDAESRYTRPDGTAVWVHVTSSLVRDDHGAPLYYFSQVQDMTARHEAEARLAHQAGHDSLTGLGNRAALMDALGAIDGDGAALILLDIADFTQINDGLGYDVGDRVLCDVAQRLTECTRAGDLVVRTAGDEFAVLLPGLGDAERAQRVATTLRAALERPLVLENFDLHIGTSIGVAAVLPGAPTTGLLLRQADLALQRAVTNGGGIAVYGAEDDRDVATRLALVADLRRAIDNGEIVAHYQPKIALRTGAVVGVEALARWHHPERGFVSPGDFIPLAEQTGLIQPLTKRMLHEALGQWSYWAAEGISVDLAVNLSPRTLLDPELIRWVSAALVMHNVPGRRLLLEITENTLADGEPALQAMAALRRLGVRLSVDDLGTGYSSLLYLKQLPVDELKVDRGFIRHLAEDPRDQAIVTAIVALGAALGLDVVAEGVEDDASLAVLRDLGCPFAQGFHIAVPTPGPELTAWLAERTEETAAR